MKTRALYLFLAAGIVVLIVAAGLLARSLFSIPVDAPVAKPATTVQPDVPKVTETVLDVAAPITKADRPQATPAPVIVDSPKSAPAPALLPPPTHPGIGGVISLRGTALAVAAKASPRTLAQDARVFMNEQIETGPKTKLKIRFDDGSVLSQGENSAVLIDEYLYAPDKADQCGFAMRLMKGTCRVITGLITKANPDRFKVRTRMATVGIRGCDVAFRSQLERDDIYVLELAGEKKVIITAARDGASVVDPATGKDRSVDEANRQTVEFAEGGNQLSVVPGKGIVDQRRMNQDDIREVVGETSYLPPARHDLNQRPDGATFTIQPGEANPTPADNPDKAQ